MNLLKTVRWTAVICKQKVEIHVCECQSTADFLNAINSSRAALEPELFFRHSKSSIWYLVFRRDRGKTEFDTLYLMAWFWLYISVTSPTSVKSASLYLSDFRTRPEIDSGITKRKILLGTNSQEKWHSLGLKMELIYSPAPLAAKQKWEERMGSDNSDESCGILLWAGTKAVLKTFSRFSESPPSEKSLDF